MKFTIPKLKSVQYRRRSDKSARTIRRAKAKQKSIDDKTKAKKWLDETSKAEAKKFANMSLAEKIADMRKYQPPHGLEMTEAQEEREYFRIIMNRDD